MTPGLPGKHGRLPDLGTWLNISEIPFTHLIHKYIEAHHLSSIMLFSSHLNVSTHYPYLKHRLGNGFLRLQTCPRLCIKEVTGQGLIQVTLMSYFKLLTSQRVVPSSPKLRGELIKHALP